MSEGEAVPGHSSGLDQKLERCAECSAGFAIDRCSCGRHVTSLHGELKFSMLILASDNHILPAVRLCRHLSTKATFQPSLLLPHPGRMLRNPHLSCFIWRGAHSRVANESHHDEVAEKQRVQEIIQYLQNNCPTVYPARKSILLILPWGPHLSGAPDSQDRTYRYISYLSRNNNG
jgi:hypothetical protein